MSSPKSAREQERLRDQARRTHRIGPMVTRVGDRQWVVDTQIVIPKSGRPYRREMPSPRASMVRREAEKIRDKGTASVVVTVAGIIDEDLYEGKDLIPKGSFVMISRRIPGDALTRAFEAGVRFDTPGTLSLAIGRATDFRFSQVKSVYIREDRVGGGVG